MWCWERLEKISWTDRVRNGWVLQRIKERRNILHTVKEGKLTGFVSCCVETAFKTRYRTEDRKIEVTGRRGRRRKHLLEVLKEMKWYRNLKEEALDRTLWRTGFGRGCGPVLRQTVEWMNCFTVVRYSFENACQLSAQTANGTSRFPIDTRNVETAKQDCANFVCVRLFGREQQRYATACNKSFWGSWQFLS
jgi:hypothetical protein